MLLCTFNNFCFYFLFILLSILSYCIQLLSVISIFVIFSNFMYSFSFMFTFIWFLFFPYSIACIVLFSDEISYTYSNILYEPRQANLCLRAFRHDKF